MLYKNSSKGNEEFAWLRTGLSRAIRFGNQSFEDCPQEKQLFFEFY